MAGRSREKIVNGHPRCVESRGDDCAAPRMLRREIVRQRHARVPSTMDKRRLDSIGLEKISASPMRCASTTRQVCVTGQKDDASLQPLVAKPRVGVDAGPSIGTQVDVENRQAGPERLVSQSYQLLITADPHASTLENSGDQFHDDLAQVIVVLHVENEVVVHGRFRESPCRWRNSLAIN